MAGGLSFNMGAKKGPKLAFGLKPQAKAKKAQAAFAPDSDDEGEAEPDRKRAKRAYTEAPAPPVDDEAAPLDAEQQKTADRLAEFVAKHGRNFEDITRKRNTENGPFRFLFDTSSTGYKYYERKIEEFSGRKTPGFLDSTPIPPAPKPVAQTRLPDPTAAPSSTAAPRAQKITTPIAGTSSEPPVPGGSQARQDSLAAMEAFTKLAAKRDEERGEQEAKLPLLNETSFDRRRVMSVYKQDGTRGHHMGDYIPTEELTKLLAKSGSKEAKAQAEALEAASRIQSDNIGHKLLSQMGWKEGQGLGASGSGMAAPVSAASEFGAEKRGLGSESHTAVQEGDDEFEVYRKRMMLGYKHRPNPLGNPRKAYY